MTQPDLKKAAIFFYVILNGTWALIAYLLFRVGVPLRVIAFVLCIGVILGNLALFTGVTVALKVLGRSRQTDVLGRTDSASVARMRPQDDVDAGSGRHLGRY